MLSQEMARARASDRIDRAARATRNRQLLAARQPDNSPRRLPWRPRATNRAAGRAARAAAGRKAVQA